MAGITEVRRDMRAEFTRTARSALDQSAKAAFTEILGITVEKFVRDAAKLKPPVHVWKKKKFKKFILGNVRRIAIEADRNATDGVINRKVLNDAAVTVMKRSQKFCTVRIVKGKVQDLRSGHFSDYSPGESNGEVCSTFLANQTI